MFEMGRARVTKRRVSASSDYGFTYFLRCSALLCGHFDFEIQRISGFLCVTLGVSFLSCTIFERS